MSDLIIICTSDGECTCGAPAATPSGMHHCDCAVHPGWCGRQSCRPCEENGKVRHATTKPDPEPLLTDAERSREPEPTTETEETTDA